MFSLDPVPRQAGVYAWYLRGLDAVAPDAGCPAVDGARLLYVGISPKRPSAAGRASVQTLRARIRYHFRGNAAGSTLRLTLGSLLASELQLSLRRVGSGRRMTFHAGEERLSAWMAQNAFVCWFGCPEPWLLEEHLIGAVAPPLNIRGNLSGSAAQVVASRAAQRAAARALPVL